MRSIHGDTPSLSVYAQLQVRVYLSAVDVLDGGLPEEEVDVIRVLHRTHEVGSWKKRERRVKREN